MYIFEISMKKDEFFDTPFDLIKEKKFSTHSRVSVYFLWTKQPKMEATTQYFDAPFDLLKKKSFHLLERTMNFFESWKRSKMEETAQNFEKRFFYKQILDFHCPSKILCHTSNLWNFVKITGPYYTCTV